MNDDFSFRFVVIPVVVIISVVIAIEIVIVDACVYMNISFPL